MNYFLLFKPDKKEPWRMYTREQLENPSKLKGPPAFQTVLMVDQDPEQVIENDLDPIDTVKYLGPMYLDFDDADNIDNVLADVNAVIDYLMNSLDIPEEYIHAWLSGGKGVHITVPGVIFGVKQPTKFLPMIYREIMFSIMEGAGLKSPCTLDESVYSCGRGRMWRCEGVPRPGKGTYKVGTTANELSLMDSDEYFSIVASPRPARATPEPGKSLAFPKALELFKRAKLTATRKVRAMKEAIVVPKEVLQEWEGIPGCVYTLITQGDCENSNWNQAAMQLATYIAACYEKSDEAEYMEELVKPFAQNVTSGSRPTETDRIKHIKEQLHRAFRGTIKFSVGAFIATIGKPCRACPVCRSDIATGESTQAEEENGQYNASTKIRWDANGYHLVGENGSRQLTSFTFWPDTEVFELVPCSLPNGMPGWKESSRQELRGWMVDDEGRKFTDVRVSERAWSSKRDLINAFKGQGDALVYCGDAETQKMLKAIVSFSRQKAENKELEKMTRANVCGIVFDRSGKHTVPHYVEAENSITSNGNRSPYRFNGNARQSPALLSLPNPYVDDTRLELAITALCRVNEPIAVAQVMGWFVACHFREHIQFVEPQFPLLNISGNSEAGKTSLAMLMGMLNGIDYTKAEFQNVEVGTMYPLIKFVSSSTTVPRLVEEVNPLQLGPKYSGIVGILKASWNKAPIPRGRITDRELSVSDDRVSSPIVYTSEQSATIPSLRSRSVEVRLTSRALQNKEYRDNYARATAYRDDLLRLAKVLVTVAMGTSPTRLLSIFQDQDQYIDPSVSSRPRWGHMTCLTGLYMLIHTMEEYEVKGVSHVKALYDALRVYLGGEVVESERGKSSSEVDRVLSTFNTMADPTQDERTRLEPAKHYWRQGDSLYLVLQSCLPRYTQFTRSTGDTPVIREFDQMRNLLEGEVYFERREPHPTRNADVFVISMERLSKKGTLLNNFTESTAEEEA